MGKSIFCEVKHVFNSINKDSINNETSIHDSEITMFNYDYNDKTINLNLVGTC